MATESANNGVQRRSFLKGAAAAGAAAVGGSLLPTTGAAAGVTAADPARLTPPRATASLSMVARPGSDFMVDVLKALNIEYVGVESGLELPQLPRVDHQLRRQHQARVPHLHARGVVGRHGSRLRQGRGQADGDHGPQHRWPAARRDGRLQCLVRPRADPDAGRQFLDAATRRPASSGSTAPRIPRRCSATSSSGMTSRTRCSTSPSPRCAPTRSR